MIQPANSGADASSVSDLVSELGLDASLIAKLGIAMSSTPESLDQIPQDESSPLAAVRHVVVGSSRAIQETIKTLDECGYLNASDWSQPQPSDQEGQFIAELTKEVDVEIE